MPAARSSAAVLQVRIALVLGSLVLAAAAGVFAAFAWFTQEAPKVDLTAALPDGQGLASAVAGAFLNGQPLPVPVAEGLPVWEASGSLPHDAPYWTGFRTAKLPSGLTMERHRFLFYRLLPASEEGGQPVRQLNELFVPLVLSNSGTPALGGQPVFRPVAYGDITGTTLYDTKSTLPPAAADVVKKWAVAWAAGDSTALKTLAGDGTEGVRYIGLGGCQSGDTQILSTLPIDSKTWVVRARVPVTCANGYKAEMDLDVSVEGAPPNPTYIVGWGPIGTGVQGRDSVRITTTQ